jgi:hypothetical protein
MVLLYLLPFIASTVTLGKEIYIYIYGGKCNAKAPSLPSSLQACQAPHNFGVEKRGGTALRFINVGNVEKLMVRLTDRWHHPRERGDTAHRTGGRVDPGAGLDAIENGENLCPYRQINT